jgi:hypothetical protein
MIRTIPARHPPCDPNQSAFRRRAIGRSGSTKPVTSPWRTLRRNRADGQGKRTIVRTPAATHQLLRPQADRAAHFGAALRRPKAPATRGENHGEPSPSPARSPEFLGACRVGVGLSRRRQRVCIPIGPCWSSFRGCSAKSGLSGCRCRTARRRFRTQIRRGPVPPPGMLFGTGRSLNCRRHVLAQRPPSASTTQAT